MGEGDHEQGISSQGGSGRYDKATGIYEFYQETPAELVGGASAAPPWTAVLNQWFLLEPAFHSTFNVDLEEVLHSKTWRWFATRVSFLLITDNPLARHFAPKSEE